MNLHEYQGKSILKSFGVAIQEGIVIDKAEDAVSAAEKLNKETGTSGSWLRHKFMPVVEEREQFMKPVRMEWLLPKELIR